jgi:hypothetical protein|tara:strand:+ start:949 stop:1464 length:516 start_codon:yes stop_codon:yes gene_type:complete
MRAYAETTHRVDLKRQFKEKQMGRPLRKDVNGIDVIRFAGTNSTDTNAGIILKGYFAADSGLNADYMIIKQRGANTFVVLSAAKDTFVDGETITGPTSSYFRTGKLVVGTPNAEGEIQMLAYLAGGADASVTAIAKITKRVATDFSGNRYTWEMTNFEDSAADQIELTLIV